MNRKEQILEGAIQKSFYNDKLVAFIEGALWADENSKDGAKELIQKAYDFNKKILNHELRNEKEIFELQNDLYEYLK
jgi:hypothetical protein